LLKDGQILLSQRVKWALKLNHQTGLLRASSDGNVDVGVEGWVPVVAHPPQTIGGFSDGWSKSAGKSPLEVAVMSAGRAVKEGIRTFLNETDLVVENLLPLLLDWGQLAHN
jgi:hypothetical protein